MIQIIMSTYLGERYLREQVDSILGQDRTDWTLRIRDDGSRDRTAAIGEDYADRFPEKIFFSVNDANLGAAKNFMEGLLKAYRETDEETGAYFAFADQDDVWDKDKLSVVMGEMERLEKQLGKGVPIAVCTDVRVTDAAGKVLSPSYFTYAGIDPEALDLPHLLMENKCIGGTMAVNRALTEMLSRAAARRGHLPKHMIMHDWWLALMAAAFGRLSLLPRATEDYRQHGSNVFGGQSFGSYVRARARKVTDIRAMIERDIAQGREFGQFFAKELAPGDKEVVETFASLKNKSFSERRKLLREGGYLKSGRVRNTALWFFI